VSDEIGAPRRDYAKFLGEHGQLNVRLIPRPVYLQMLERYKAVPEHIDAVYGELYWLWDLNARAKTAAEAGRAATRAEVAQELAGEMDDRDWWKLTETFEQHLWRDFAADAASYADLLDPLYDLQEAEGWRDLHYAQVELPG
jgi:hypothetical protein